MAVIGMWCGLLEYGVNESMHEQPWFAMRLSAGGIYCYYYGERSVVASAKSRKNFLGHEG